MNVKIYIRKQGSPEKALAWEGLLDHVPRMGEFVCFAELGHPVISVVSFPFKDEIHITVSVNADEWELY